MMTSKSSKVERNKLIEDGKGKTINEIKLLNIKYKTMLLFCLKCKKFTENINLRVSKLVNTLLPKYVKEY